MKRQANKIVGIALLVLVVVTAGIILYRNLPGWVTEKVRNRLIEQLNPEEKDIYKVEVDEVSIDAKLGVTIPRISVNPHQNVYSNISPAQVPQTLFSFNITDFHLSLKNILALIRSKESLSLNNLNITGDKIVVYSNDSIGEKDTPGKEERKRNINLSDLDIKVNLIELRSFPDTAFLRMSVREIKLAGDIASGQVAGDTTATYSFDNYSIAIGAMDYFPLTGLYTYHLNSVSMVSPDDDLFLEDIRITPMYDKTEFQKHNKYQSDRIQASFRNFVISGFNINQLVNEKIFYPEAIAIKTGDIDIYRDRNLPDDTLRRPPMPTRLIRKAALGMHIGRISLEGITMNYSELPKEGTTEGVVPFSNLKATITNVTNLSSHLQQDSIMRISASAILFDEAMLKANFIYNLMDVGGGFQASGEVEELDFVRINSALQPLTGFRIASGKLHGSTFKFSGNDTNSSGEVVLLYTNLSAEQDKEQSTLRSNLTKFLGRNLVYHPSNPSSEDKPRTGKIYFERNLSRSVFHYWWHSYLTGIKDSVLREAASALMDD